MIETFFGLLLVALGAMFTAVLLTAGYLLIRMMLDFIKEELSS